MMVGVRSRLATAERQVQVISEKQDTLQKQLLKMAGLMAAAIAARVALQTLPFVEPITLATLLAGTLWGRKKGAYFGASIMFLSNFAVFGGNGPWTVLQCVGMAIAGTIGSKLLVTGRRTAIVAAVTATTVYDMITNTLWIAMVGPVALVSALPIYLLHLATNVVMAMALPEAAKKLAQ